MAERKNFDWIDTIRVLSTLNIIFFHYVVLLMENPNLQDAFFKYAVGIGYFGIAAFFGISGYLVVNSLQRSPSIWEFYRRKFIRVVLPFTAAYIIVVPVILCLKKFQMYSEILTPEKIIVGLFPFDLNLLKFLDIPALFSVGEWFIGTIIWMYLISPLIYKFLRRNVPITMAGIIFIACATSIALSDLQEQGRIFSTQSFFLVRLPEFATGMALFLYKEKIFQNSVKILALLLTGGIICYSVFLNIDHPSIWHRYFFGTGTDLHLILALILSVYWSFSIAEFLNRNFPRLMIPINNFKDISYIAVLFQHLIIDTFEKVFDFNNMSAILAVILFLAVLLTIIIVSTILKKFYDPFEKKLLNWNK